MVMRSSPTQLLILIMFFFCHVLAFAAPADPHVTSLFRALNAGDGKKIDTLLHKYPALVHARQDGQTLLSEAVNDAPTTVLMLLHDGVNVNVRNNTGDTALHEAVENNDQVTAALLVSHGARDETNGVFNAIARDDVMDLNAVLNKLPPYLRDAELSSHGFQFSTIWTPGQKPRSIVFVGRWPTGITPLNAAVFWHRADMIPLLLAKGAKINEKDDIGKTPLHTAVGQCDKQMVLLLLAHGADVNAKTLGQVLYTPEADGLTPLHIAVQSCGSDMVSLLISHGAEVNSRDSYGDTPLFYAINRRKVEIVSTLLGQGAEPNVRNTFEMRDSGGGETPLHDAVIDWNEENSDNEKTTMLSIMTLLLSHGANVNAKDNRGLTPLGLTQQNDAVAALLRQHGGRNFGKSEIPITNRSVSVIVSFP